MTMQPTLVTWPQAADVEHWAQRLRARRWLRAIALGVVFGLVHVWLIATSLKSQTGLVSDLALYREWMATGRGDGIWPVIDGSWVYPALAVLPMLPPMLVSTELTMAYAAGWCGLVVLVNAVTCLVIAKLVPARRASVIIVFWLVFLGLLGPVAMARIDAIATPLILIALVVVRSRPWLATVLLTVGAWVKVAPGAVVIPLIAVVRRRVREVIAPAATVCLVVVGAFMALGASLGSITSFVTEQGDRGLQAESVLATPIVLMHAIKGIDLARDNTELRTLEAYGEGAEALGAVSNYLLPLCVVAIAVFAIRARKHGFEALLLGTLAATVGMIVSNKVGSPQFVAWIGPAAAVGLACSADRRTWKVLAAMVACTAAMTQLVFPFGYTRLMNDRNAIMVVDLTLRNALLIVILGFTLAKLATIERRLPGPVEELGVARP